MIQKLAGLRGLGCYDPTPPLPEHSGLTGSWYDPSSSGQGMVLHTVTDRQMVIAFYGFKPTGERLWLLGNVNEDLDTGVALSVDMFLAEGGNFGDFDASDITESPWGTLLLQFEDCRSGMATLEGLDGNQTLDLVKLAGLQGSELGCP